MTFVPFTTVLRCICTKMSDDEGPKKAKIPRVLKPKDREKRLIVILERASLETVKVKRFL